MSQRFCSKGFLSPPTENDFLGVKRYMLRGPFSQEMRRVNLVVEAHSKGVEHGRQEVYVQEVMCSCCSLHSDQEMRPTKKISKQQIPM